MASPSSPRLRLTIERRFEQIGALEAHVVIITGCWSSLALCLRGCATDRARSAFAAFASERATRRVHSKNVNIFVAAVFVDICKVVCNIVLATIVSYIYMKLIYLY